MNRRGFFGLVGKLLQVGTAMAVAPELLAPAAALVEAETVNTSTFLVTDFKVYYDGPDFALAS